MSTTGTPAAEVHADEEMVRALIREQHPDLAGEAISGLDAGWDNAMYRLGDALVVRLPRREIAVPLLLNEQRWLPQICENLTLPVPKPIRVGRPAKCFPWSWSIVPWINGEAADRSKLDSKQAGVWADFLKSLHYSAHEHAPANPFRGVLLALRSDAVIARLEELKRHCPSEEIERWSRIWWRAVESSPSAKRCWLHGDLHARNVIVAEDALAGVIDWGDLTAGDPATDLASIWSLFTSSDDRASCLDQYGATHDEAIRAKGWAINFGTALLVTGLVDHPRHEAMGRAILNRLLEDD